MADEGDVLMIELQSLPKKGQPAKTYCILPASAKMPVQAFVELASKEAGVEIDLDGPNVVKGLRKFLLTGDPLQPIGEVLPVPQALKSRPKVKGPGGPLCDPNTGEPLPGQDPTRELLIDEASPAIEECYPCTDRYQPQPYLPSLETEVVPAFRDGRCILEDREAVPGCSEEQRRCSRHRNVLFVSCSDGRWLEIPFGTFETGLWYRERVAEALGTDLPADMSLHYAGKPLRDDQRHSGLAVRSILHCDLGSAAEPADEPMDRRSLRKPTTRGLYIRTLDGRTLTFRASDFGALGLTTTVLGLKQLISGRTGLPTAAVRLIFAGKELRDDQRRLDEYNLEYNVTLHLVPTLPLSAAPPSAPSMGIRAVGIRPRLGSAARATAAAGQEVLLRFGPDDLSRSPQPVQLRLTVDDAASELETQTLLSRLRTDAAQRELEEIASTSVRAQAERDVHLAVQNMLESGENEETVECFSHTIVIQLERCLRTP